MSALDDDLASGLGSASARRMANMHVHLLGPVEVVSDDGPVALGGPKPRALLAMLALEVGSTVSAERLIDGLWGEEPPATAAKMVQLYVSQLRKAMAARRGTAEIVTRGRGYELRVGRDERGRRALRAALAAGRGARGAGACGAARRWPTWRSSRSPRPRSGASRSCALAALELAIEQDLEAGRHREMLGELEALLAQEPLRERLHAQRMLALYRCGRQADALEAYRQARATLVEQIGVEPGPGAATAARGDPAPGPGARPARASAAELPPELDASTPLVGPRRRARAAARALAARARRRRRGRARRGRARHGQDAPGGRARRARSAAMAATVRTLGAATPEARSRAGRRGRGGAAHAAGARRSGPAGEDVQAALARAARAAGRECRCSCRIATAIRAGALRADETLTLEPLGARRGARRWPASTPARARTQSCRSSGSSRRAAASPRRCTARRAEWARADARAARSARRRPARGRARRVLRAAEDDLAGGVVELQAAARARRRSLRDAERLVGLPVQGARLLRGGGRRGLLRSRAARRRDGGAAGRRAADGRRRAVGQRQVVGAARRAAAPRCADGVLPGSERWPLALIRPGEHPLAALERAIADAAPGASAGGRRRPVRGGVHGLPRRGRARRVRRRARRVRARPAPQRRSCSSPCAPTSTGAAPAYPELSRTARRQPRARRADAPRTSCAARSSCPPAAPACASSPSSSTR